MRCTPLALLLFAVASLTACSDSSPLPVEPVGQTVEAPLEIARTRVTSQVGDPLRLSLRGRAASSPHVRWSVDDPSVAVVEDGVVHFLRAGSTRIVASAGALSASTIVSAFGSVTVASATIAPGDVSAAPGDLLPVRLVVKYSNGASVSLRSSPTWRTANASVARPERGHVRAVSTGDTELVSSLGPFVDTADVRVTALEPGEVALSIVRFDGGAGEVGVSSGVPLAPGVLRPGDEGRVRVWLDGAERAVHVAPLAGRHPDGSLQAVLVQLRAAVPATGLIGRLTLTTARPAGQTLAAPVVGPEAQGLPTAVLLPSDPAYLIATQLVGPTVSVAETEALGGDFARYERDFVKYANTHWAARGDAWGENYYDRVQIYYAWWVRTGNPEYWHRATRILLNYRREYLEKNNYGSSPHWAQLEGLATHYWLTGDEASRKAIGAVADILYGGFHRREQYLGLTSGPNFESRIAARVVQGELLAWRLGANDRYGKPADWAARLDDALPKVARMQGVNGEFAYAITCYETLNYMDGMLADVLIEVHRTYRPDPVIQPVLQRLAAYHWGQWLQADSAFKYISGKCEGVGSGGPAPDLNQMQLNLYAWLYRQTGDPQYRAKADVIFSGGVRGAFLSGNKQFNQSYTTSYRYLAYRR